MPSSGGKSITPVPAPSPTGASITGPCAPVSLTRYAARLGIGTLFFWGVRRGNVSPERQLFFSGNDRWNISVALNNAAEMIEQEIRVHLCPTWDTQRNVFTYSHDNPLQLDWKEFIQGGQRGFSVYDASAAVVYTGDVGTVTVAHGGVGSVDEVRVYYNDGLYSTGPEPDRIEFGSTNIVITFRREKLLDPDLMFYGDYHRDALYEPPAWETITNFVSSVSVAREYNDPSVNACFRVRRECNTQCTWRTQTGCIQAEDEELGWVNAFPATYTASSQTWRRGHFVGYPEQVELYYQSGLTSLPRGFEDAIIRLAHSTMPDPPCPFGGEPVQRYWRRDRMIHQPVTREVRNSPWGPMEGAWFAWNLITNSPYNYNRGGGWMGSPHRQRRHACRTGIFW